MVILTHYSGFSATMSKFFPIFFIWVILLLTSFTDSCSTSWCPQNYIRQISQKFQQKTHKFWEFDEQSNSWVEVKLPFDLVSCVNDNCTKVGSIDQMIIDKNEEQKEDFKKNNGYNNVFMPLRKRVSLIKMSEASIWVTGVSGSIYERFWNGLQWVIAPHDLPVSAGFAVASFIVNQTILALSDAGNLYQVYISCVS